MDMVSNHGLMVRLMSANFAVEKLMDRVNILNRAVAKPTMVCGSMMSNMAKEKRPGKMVPNTMENI